MADGHWAGLVTNASPFAIPPTAAVEQVNLTVVVPGQLQSRGGMRPVSFVGAASSARDVFSTQFDGEECLLVLQADGSLVAVRSPAYGPELDRPAEPDLSVSSGGRAFAYTLRYVDGAYGAVSDAPPQPPQDGVDYISGIDGGTGGTGSWPYYVDGMLLCGGTGKESVYDAGGIAASYEPSLPVTALCAP